jgi:2-oxoglutarate dehydrogenase E2 component (dihydrolipoamide succinyltransferase)
MSTVLSELKVPTMGESITEATILQWNKADGDAVTPDDLVAELETDKTTVELWPPQSGVLRILKSKGTTVAVGEVIAKIESGSNGSKTAPAAPASPGAAAPAAAAKLSPAVQHMVADKKLDPSQIPATGPKGNLTKGDVIKFQEQGTNTKGDSDAAKSSQKGQGNPQVGHSTEGTTTVYTGAAQRTGGTSPAVPPLSPDQDITRQEMSKLRQTIAKRLVEAQHATASLTTFNEIDMSAVMAMREKYKEKFEKTYNIGLGFMSFFAKAVCSALKAVPAVNAQIQGNELVYRRSVQLGIAVSTEKGLMVPVVRDADRLSMWQIEADIKRLATKARDGKITVDELGGGTFTITNGGVFGSLLSTPILNPPQSAILGMHKIEKRAVVVGDEIVIRPMMYVALTYDHRVIDGQQSVTFLVKIKEALEDPARLLLEI